MILYIFQEQKIMQLNEEVGRLRDVEMESFRKDAYIQTLQQMVNDLKSKFAEQQPLIMGQDVNLTQKICQLENDVTTKEQELSAVREQVLKRDLKLVCNRRIYILFQNRYKPTKQINIHTCMHCTSRFIVEELFISYSVMQRQCTYFPLKGQEVAQKCTYTVVK